MALLDILTDGTDEINLASATSGFTDRYSYKQKIVEKNALGEYEAVVEKMHMNWNGADDEKRGDQHAKLMRLQRKARKCRDGDTREGYVWRELRSVSEGAVKYMVVTDVRIVELDAEFYGPDGIAKGCLMEITREGAPRLTQPGSWLDLTGAVTVYDYNVGSENNWATVLKTLLEGDADALLRFTMTFGKFDYGANNQIIIAKRSANSEAELVKLIPHFNPSDLVDATGAEYTLTTDANAPGGKRLDVANTSGGEIERYYVWSYDPDFYQGEFMMMVAIKMIGSDDICYITPFHSEVAGVGYPSMELGGEAYVPPGKLGVYQQIFAGRITLPPSGYTPVGETETASYGIGFKIRIPNNVSFRILNWWLIPADGGVQEIRGIGVSASSSETGIVVVVNGDLKRTYRKAINMSSFPAQAGGRYLTADHQKYTRFYFFSSYWDESTQVDAVSDGLNSITVRIEAVPRVKGIAAGLF